MKRIFFYISILTAIFTGCQPTEQEDYKSKCDSLFNALYETQSDLEIQASECTRLSFERDSISEVCNSIKSELFLANFKIEKCRSYLRICYKNPSQDKFLKGWINRAVN